MIGTSKGCCWLCFYACMFLITGSTATEKAVASSGSGNVVIRKIPFNVNQGVAVDEKYFYPISNTRISKCDKSTGRVIASWQANTKEKAYKHFKHLNSGVVVEGRLYCAHSRYGIDANDCSVEIWNVEKESLAHEETIRMPRKHGSLTWIDRHADRSWWMCYAVYGKDKNRGTRLVKYQYQGGKFIEVESWLFPKEVIANWGKASCSGGSWGSDGYLYTTGHDHAVTYVLQIDKKNRLSYVRTEKGVGFFGQAIAWDRSSKDPILWGIVKKKFITLTLMPVNRHD